MKRLLVTILSIALLLSMFTFVNAEEGSPVLVIACKSSATIEDFETNGTTLILEEKFGVDLKFMELPADDAAAKLAVLINSGSELPDIINIGLNESTILRYAKDGVIIPLDDYLDDHEMMKNYWNPYYEIDEAKNAVYMSQITMADGHRYGLPCISGGPWNQASLKMFINKGWLDQLGMDIPQTTEEFTAVLEAFTSNDMNGNGIQDEIGLIGGSAEWPFCDLNGFLLGSFTKNTRNDNYFYVEDGVVKAAFIEDGFRSGLEYINSLVEAGYIYSASYTQSATQAKAIINVEDASQQVCGVIASNSDSGIGTDYFYENYVMLSPLEGPEGVRFSETKEETATTNWYITSACEYPELAFAIGEYGYDPHMQAHERYGTEGVNFTFSSEITENYCSRIPSIGYECEMAVLDDSLWTASTQNDNWHQSMPYMQNTVYLAKSGLQMNRPESELTMHNLFDKYYMSYTTEAYFGDFVNPYHIGTLKFTDEETTEMADMKTAITTYVNEKIMQFVTGGRSLDEWDAYVAELYTMGLEQLLEIYQNAYDRIN